MTVNLFLFFFIAVLSIKDTATKNIVCSLGDAKCTIDIHNNKNFIANIIILHENETTNSKSFLSLSDPCPFILYEIKQDGCRLLKYEQNNKSYYFDPNRMFSMKGIRNTLKKNNQFYTENITKNIKIFADNVLQIIVPKNPAKYIIAMHNNTNGKFSVNSYLNSPNAAQVYICKSNDPDDFFIVTNKMDFTFFKSQFQNVVLQSKVAIDDGSLSIYCQSNNIPYINIEAEKGHLKKQTEMLRLCQLMLYKQSNNNNYHYM